MRQMQSRKVNDIFLTKIDKVIYLNIKKKKKTVIIMNYISSFYLSYKS